eukprot:gnl/MRDRNA2_/MRDRNA2_181180_c0_seq1.p1 gnl/MRDRNA2_/MRDRNA2_181180_c0~~gnl/MRDRNA2_/MRDRNA2_181180_c0_seq1.p1  ORF type:complete len:234 (-),score=17.72 gnl/MRDRNA2_/MRDRNA2_181180_c0_seq1:133-834(-)
MNQPGDNEGDDWGYDTFPLSPRDVSYAIGGRRGTISKLAKASNCLVDAVGDTVFMAGTERERRLARDYLGCLLLRMKGRFRSDFHDREDCVKMTVPYPVINQVAGPKGDGLRIIEIQTHTFCFFDDDSKDVEADTQDIVVCSYSDENIRLAKRAIQDKWKEWKRENRIKDNEKNDNDNDSRERSRERDHSRDRSRDRDSRRRRDRGRDDDSRPRRNYRDDSRDRYPDARRRYA